MSDSKSNGVFKRGSRDMKLLLPVYLSLTASSVVVGFAVPPTPILRQNNHALMPQLWAGQRKNAVDEILDALDTLAGVSPLSEADLRDSNVDLVQRVEERTNAAPPSDALQKPSVAVFFFLLGMVPVVLMVTAVNAGVRPFGL